MSRAVFQPVTQVRLTNVAVVRVHKMGKRFEVACYRNKVVNWRNHVETDLDEVLQIAQIFQNVSKGVIANKKDIAKAFGTDDENEVIRFILDKGEVQVSDKERKAQYESLFRDVATIISEKCVNPTSNRPYTVRMIENAMREVHFSVHPNKAAKAQALELVPKLKEVMPITRARMKLHVNAAAAQGPAVRSALEQLGAESFSEETHTGGANADEYGVDLLIDPGLFRGVEEAVRTATGGSGRVDVLQLSVQQEGEADIDLEAARKGIMAMQVSQKSAQQSSDAAAAAAAADTSDSAAAAATADGAAAGAASDTDDNDDDDAVQQQQQQQPAKAAAKKSKKARRKEKEEAADRELKLAETRRRQAERRNTAAAQQQQQHDSSAVTTDAASHSTSAATHAAAAAAAGGASSSSSSGSSSRRLKCNTCAAAFPDTTAYREHFKTDWHRYNLKIKMKGLPVVSESEFRSVDAEEFFFEET